MLVHIGLDTVELEGEGFICHVKQGQKVSRGDLIISVDLAMLEEKDKSSITPIVIANSDQYHIKAMTAMRVSAGNDTVMEITTLN